MGVLVFVVRFGWGVWGVLHFYLLVLCLGCVWGFVRFGFGWGRWVVEVGFWCFCLYFIWACRVVFLVWVFTCFLFCFYSFFLVHVLAARWCVLFVIIWFDLFVFQVLLLLVWGIFGLCVCCLLVCGVCCLGGCGFWVLVYCLLFRFVCCFGLCFVSFFFLFRVLMHMFWVCYFLFVLFGCLL